MARRIVSVWLPTWATDRIRAAICAPPLLVTSMRDGQRMVLGAVDAEARRLGLRPGMALTQARALVPGLAVHPAEQAQDLAGLERLAGWSLRYSPLVSAGPPDGLWLDISGCAHLFGGEAELLQDLLKRLNAGGFAARAAVADTAGAAWAVARHGRDPLTVVPVGGAERAIADFGIAALRVQAETVDVLARMGLERIKDLMTCPRGPLARRFRGGLLRRLDQALGRVSEPIQPIVPPDVISARMDFAEPVITREALANGIERLAKRVCAGLEKAGLGVRRLDLLCGRADGTAQAVRVGTAASNRHAAHLTRLLGERLEAIEPREGIETMRLVATLTQPLAAGQTSVLAEEPGSLSESVLQTFGGSASGHHAPSESVIQTSGGSASSHHALAGLVDVLRTRLGEDHVFRAGAVESDIPERSVRRIAVGEASVACWPDLPRPVRLFSPAQPIESLALLPDHPPAAFTWRGKRFRVQRADGPERIYGEWWRDFAEAWAVRDYWRVEDTEGRRFWLYRSGDGEHPETGDLRWFLHGIF